MAYSDLVYRPPREDYLSPVNPNDSRFIRPPREDYLSPVNPNDSRFIRPPGESFLPENPGSGLGVSSNDPAMETLRGIGRALDDAERQREIDAIVTKYSTRSGARTPRLDPRPVRPRGENPDGSVTIDGKKYFKNEFQQDKKEFQQDKKEFQQDAKGGETAAAPVVEPPSLFDNPPLSSSDAPFPKAWGDEDDAHVSSLVYEATLPSSMVNPVDAMGEDGWRKMVLSDIEHGGADALAEFRFSWDAAMSPARKAKMLSDVAFDREMTSIVEAAANDVKPLVDPDEYAEQVRTRRARR